jgi:hypothetical protein
VVVIMVKGAEHPRREDEQRKKRVGKSQSV